MATHPVARARMVAEQLTTLASEVDDRGEFPIRGRALLGETGLMGLTVPKEYGGFGSSLEVVHDVCRILGGACLSTAMVWAMHAQQAAIIADHGSEALKRDVLPKVASGQMFIASVTSERGKGGHILTAVAPLLRSGDSLLLSREAPVVTGGYHAEGYLITMRASEESLPSDVVMVFAHRSQLETKLASGWSALGMRGTHSVGMHLQGRLPACQLFTPEKGFAQIATSTDIPMGHLLWGSCWLGAAEGVYRGMLAILSDPAARRGYNLQSDLFAERLARVRLAIDATGAVIRETLREYAGMRERHALDDAIYMSPGFNLRINQVKVFASEMLFEAVDRLMQVGGLRYGYLKNPRVNLERAFRDLRAASLMYGNDRLLVANGKLALVDRSAFQSFNEG
jgi:acyl-CoA dehydrogenase